MLTPPTQSDILSNITVSTSQSRIDRRQRISEDALVKSIGSEDTVVEKIDMSTGTVNVGAERRENFGIGEAVNMRRESNVKADIGRDAQKAANGGESSDLECVDDYHKLVER